MRPDAKVEAAIALANKYRSKTDLENRLSYSDGVKSMIDIDRARHNIKLQIRNTTTDQQRVLLHPAAILGKYVFDKSEDKIQADLSKFGINGVRSILKVSNTPGADILSVKSLNSDQDVDFMFCEMANTPTQIQGISLRSFHIANGVGENTNYGNPITRYTVDSLSPKKYATINLADFQTSADVTTSIVKVDFINENFPAKITQKDFIEIYVNPGTMLDVTLFLGGRDSREDRFHRDVDNATKMLKNEFPTRFARSRF